MTRPPTLVRALMCSNRAVSSPDCSSRTVSKFSLRLGSSSSDRKAAKDLFNALDNDGSLEAWERRQGCPAMMQMPPFSVGTDGEVFSLRAYQDDPGYQDGRRALTGEFVLYPSDAHTGRLCSRLACTPQAR
jgi:hypothetical protein